RRARRLAAGCRAHPPFRADTAMAVLRRVCDDTSRPIREINPEIPEWMAAVVAKLQAKDPGQRFATAAEVAALLSRRLTQLQTGAEVSDSGTAATRLAGPRPRPGARLLTGGRVAAVGAVVAGPGGTGAVGPGRGPGRRLFPAGRLAAVVAGVGVVLAGWLPRGWWLPAPPPATDAAPVAAQPEAWKPRPPLLADELANLP